MCVVVGFNVVVVVCVVVDFSVVVVVCVVVAFSVAVVVCVVVAFNVVVVVCVIVAFSVAVVVCVVVAFNVVVIVCIVVAFSVVVVKSKGSSYIAPYPILRTVQSALHFTSLTDLFTPDTISASLGSIQPYATINARRLLLHISTTVYSQVLI